MLKQIFKYFTNIYKVILISLTSVMFVVVGTNVFSRFVLNRSLGWADELSRFIFIWISLLGAVMAYYENRHIGLDFLVEKVRSKKIKAFIVVLGDVLVLIVLLFLAYFGLDVANSAGNVSPALYIPMRTVYMILPISSALMALISISKVYVNTKILLGISNKEEPLVEINEG